MLGKSFSWNIIVILVWFAGCSARPYFSFFGGESRNAVLNTNCAKSPDLGVDHDQISVNQVAASNPDFQIYEYRIPMPMNLEEFDIGRNFMISRVNEQERDGAGGKAVNFVSLEMRNHSMYGIGQHSVKWYNIARRMPAWMRPLVSTPLVLSEEAWNFYPYTQAVLRLPMLSKFSLRIQTLHLNGTGHENAHQVSKLHG